MLGQALARTFCQENEKSKKSSLFAHIPWQIALLSQDDFPKLLIFVRLRKVLLQFAAENRWPKSERNFIQVICGQALFHTSYSNLTGDSICLKWINTEKPT